MSDTVTESHIEEVLENLLTLLTSKIEDAKEELDDCVHNGAANSYAAGYEAGTITGLRAIEEYLFEALSYNAYENHLNGATE